MNNRISEAQTEYRARGWGDKNCRIHTTDLFEVMEMSKGDAITAMIAALEAGYMLGYKAGMADKKLYDYSKLRSLIIEKYGTLKAFADALGVNPSTLSARLQSVSYWPQGDIEKACALLGISNPQEYFFVRKSNS